MVIDSSALVAILTGEPEMILFNRMITRSETVAIPSPTLFETSMVLVGKRGEATLDRLDRYVRGAAIQIIPFTADHAAAARAAFLRYGKGRHPAALNFGDCIAYSAAKLENLPLLFKGDDFRRTDIRAAI